MPMLHHFVYKQCNMSSTYKSSFLFTQIHIIVYTIWLVTGKVSTSVLFTTQLCTSYPFILLPKQPDPSSTRTLTHIISFNSSSFWKFIFILRELCNSYFHQVSVMTLLRVWVTTFWVCLHSYVMCARMTLWTPTQKKQNMHSVHQ